MDYNVEEFLIIAITKILNDLKVGHVAVGAASPIPGSAALLRQALSDNGEPRVSIIHGEANNPFTDGGRELFDAAGQGRIDVFFLGGVQIDGRADINLIGIGSYPNFEKRFSGSFGSAYMYFVVPTVILFSLEHTRRVFVKKVDFISAPGCSEKSVYRPGGPKWLVTNLCLMTFNSDVGRFRLHSVHPGHSISEIQDNTGFDFDIPEKAPFTQEPILLELSTLRKIVAPQIEKTYPNFSRSVFNR